MCLIHTVSHWQSQGWKFIFLLHFLHTILLPPKYCFIHALLIYLDSAEESTPESKDRAPQDISWIPHGTEIQGSMLSTSCKSQLNLKHAEKEVLGKAQSFGP